MIERDALEIIQNYVKGKHFIAKAMESLGELRGQTPLFDYGYASGVSSALNFIDTVIDDVAKANLTSDRTKIEDAE